MSNEYEIAIDFMDMTDERCLWVRSDDAVADIEVVIGRHVVVGDEDADPRVARVVSIDSRGNIELEILRGSVESHAGLLAHA